MLSAKEEKRAYVLNGVLVKDWTAREAAELLQISERHLWRILRRYREEGVAALVHGNRGRVPANATPEEVRERMIELAKGRYDGANYSHMSELFEEWDGISRSRWTVRRVLKRAGVGSPRRRRRPMHRSRRERRPQEGMLLQVDGSRHPWLPTGEKLTLVGAVDDATGTVPYALFREQEDTLGYLLLLEGILERKGVPLALYSDRHSIFITTDKETLEEQLLGRRQPTQVGRALEELGIQWIAAHSPQAKGRVERLWGTFQDRLQMELRVYGAQTLQQANQVLETFLSTYNARFGVPARQPGLAYQSLPGNLDPKSVLCLKYRRIVASDNTVQFEGRTFQVQPTSTRPSYARARVEVHKHLDGTIAVVHHGLTLPTREAPPEPITLRARNNPRSLARRDQKPVAHPKPAPNHPWRKPLLTKSLHHSP